MWSRRSTCLNNKMICCFSRLIAVKRNTRAQPCTSAVSLQPKRILMIRYRHVIMYHDHHKLLSDTQTSLMAMGGLSSVAKFWRLDLSHPNNRGAYCSPVVFAGAVSIGCAVEKSWQLWCTYVCVMKTLQVFFALKAYCMHKQTDTFTKCSCQYIRCTYIYSVTTIILLFQTESDVFQNILWVTQWGVYLPRHRNCAASSLPGWGKWDSDVNPWITDIVEQLERFLWWNLSAPELT